MEKSQTKGIESDRARRRRARSRKDAWKNPKQRELKAEQINVQQEGVDKDAWKNPKQRELKGRSHRRRRRHRYTRDAWKNPKQRELKDRLSLIITKLFSQDAWKNPKQRELKDRFPLLG